MTELILGIFVLLAFVSMGSAAGISAIQQKKRTLPWSVLSLWTFGLACTLLLFGIPFFQTNGWVNNAERITALVPITVCGLQLLSLLPQWKYK